MYIFLDYGILCVQTVECLIYDTVEPPIVDPPCKGHNIIIDLSTNFRTQVKAPKISCPIYYSSNTL